MFLFVKKYCQLCLSVYYSENVSFSRLIVSRLSNSVKAPLNNILNGEMSLMSFLKTRNVQNKAFSEFF